MAMSKTLGAVTGTVLIGAGVLFTQPNSPHSEARSPQWAKVRATHLELHGQCEACGQSDSLNVHHVVPFHNDPSKELDPDNLITLCTDGPGHMNCHLLFGHGGNFKCHNPTVREDVKVVREILSHKVCDIKENK